MGVVELPFERIVLTGFRATGKSLVGQLLADRLAMVFLDTDTLLCRRIGCSVAECVIEYGWERFRQLEENLLLELSKKSGVVIATGGGAVLHEQAWRSLRHGSASIWLRAEERTIVNRLETDEHSLHQRPSLTGKDPRCEIKQLLEERVPLYRSGADFAVQTDGRTPKELVDEIERQLVLLAEQYSIL